MEFKAPRDQHQQECAFHNLLCAIFTKPFQILDATQLNHMTTMADYYGALPILSYGLSGALYNSPHFLRSIKNDACRLLQSACKLRHAMLFRDCLVLSLGPMSEPRYEKFKDPAVAKLAARYHGKITSELKTIYEVFLISASCHNVQELLDLLDSCSVYYTIAAPQYLRKCLEKTSGDYVSDSFEELHAMI